MLSDAVDKFIFYTTLKSCLETPHILVGSGKKAKQTLGWQPQYSNLEDVIFHAWQWHQKLRY